MKRLLLYLLLPTLLLIAFVNLVVPDPAPGDFERRIAGSLAVGVPGQAVQVYAQRLALDPYNLDDHYAYLQAYFQQPQRTFLAREDLRDDEALIASYTRLTQEDDLRLRDIGHYGLGLIYANLQQFPAARLHLEAVRDTDLKYLNNTLGYVYWQQQAFTVPEAFFKKEILLGGNVRGATVNLGLMLYQRKQYDALQWLYATAPHPEYLPPHLERFLLLREADFRGYLGAIARRTYQHLDLLGLLSAVLILLTWLFFLHKVDVFEPERARYLSLALGLGMAFSLVSVWLYDLLEFSLGLGMNGTWWGDLLYCLFGIGLVEEAVKLLPLLVMMAFTRQVNESIDLLIYAAAGALGFAFIENLTYFDADALGTFHRRAFSAVPMHMALSAIAAYGILYAQYGQRAPGATSMGRAFGISFTIAVVLHGLYDYWLISEALPEPLRVLALAIFVYAILVFGRAITNALNHSEYFSRRQGRYLSLVFYLTGMLLAVLLFEYIAVALRYGPTLANLGLFVSMVLGGGFVVGLLAVALGQYELQRGVWMPLLGEQPERAE